MKVKYRKCSRHFEYRSTRKNSFSNNLCASDRGDIHSLDCILVISVWNVHVRPERFCWYTSRLANCFASMCQFFLKKFSEAIGEPTNNLTSATLPRIFMSVCLSVLMYLVNDMTNFKYSFTIIIASITTRPVKIFEFMQLVCTLYFLEKNFSSNLEMFLSIFDWFRIKIW